MQVHVDLVTWIKNHTNFLFYSLRLKMQIRHAKSFRINRFEKNERILWFFRRNKKYLLIVNSFAKIYYYYFWFGFSWWFLFFCTLWPWLLSSTSIDLVCFNQIQRLCQRSRALNIQTKCQWNRLSFAVVYYFYVIWLLFHLYLFILWLVGWLLLL